MNDVTNALKMAREIADSTYPPSPVYNGVRPFTGYASYEFAEHFRLNLRRLRAQHKLSQHAVALHWMVDIKPYRYHNIESGRREIRKIPTLDEVIRLCRFFDVMLEDMLKHPSTFARTGKE